MSATQWVLDPTHSEIQFKVKHLVISTVTGVFKSFSGTATSDRDDFSDAQINFSLDIASIDTNQEQRDQHLKSVDFFDSEKFPRLTFVSTSFKKVSGETYKLEGHLTIKDVTAPISLDAEFGGSAVDFYGNTKAGFEVTGKISRAAFGLVWNGVTEAGSIVVSDDVKLIANVQFAKQAEPVAA